MHRIDYYYIRWNVHLSYQGLSYFGYNISDDYDLFSKLTDHLAVGSLKLGVL